MSCRNLVRLIFASTVCIEIFKVLYLHSKIQDNSAEVVDHPLISTTKNLRQERRGEERKGDRDRIPVFYNLFVKHKRDISRVTDIVSEQKALLQPYHKPFFIQSMGAVQLNISDAIFLEHRPKGTEILTLHSLWNFCRDNKQVEKVVYLHPKGSFHPSELNENLRKFLTAGALSEECASVDDACNVCSSRFSPLPNPHTPGNMWLARCDYIRQLIDPIDFEQDMNSFQSSCMKRDTPWCDGRGRHSAEHWVHSHPSVKPCDLYKNPKYVWNYEGVPPNGSLVDKELAPAPRFDLMQYILPDVCPLNGLFLDQRLYEYWELYGSNPDQSWWGWNYLKTNRSFILLGEKRFEYLSRAKDCWKMTTKNGTVVRTNH